MRAKNRKRPRRLALWTGALLLAGLLVVLGSCMTARIPESGSRQRVLFYAAPAPLAPGTDIGPRELQSRLEQLGYKKVDQPAAPGQYHFAGRVAEIYLRPFQYPGRAFQGGLVRLRFRGEAIAGAQAITPLDAEDLRLEPQRIAGFEGETGAVLNPLRLEEAPPLLVQTLLAVEDRRFYHHPGIDPIGMGRAALANLRGHERAQGGSTLTQQLARSLYLHNRKTILRKAEEAFIAIGLELRYSKQEILEAYLNAVYWGTWGAMEIRGAREASQYYLGVPLEQADPAGIALLVALIPAPNVFSPYNSPEKALARRNLVLRRMREEGLIDQEQHRRAEAKGLPSRKRPVRSAEASYFLEAARKEVEARAPRRILEEPGTKVFTTLDTREQSAAVAAVRLGLEQLEADHRKLRRKKDPLQAAVVSVDVATGEVRALVGGRDYLLYPFNRATEAHRQAGSIFKPFTYLAALERGEREDGSFWTPATLLADEPFSVRAGRSLWKPMNYDREFHGTVTLRAALEESRNVPAARVGVEVGPRRIASVARRLGIQSPLREVYSLSLGSSEVTLLETTAAYAALAAGGTSHPVTFLRGVIGRDGMEVPLAALSSPSESTIDRRAVYLVTRMLQGVFRRGTARSARDLARYGDLAGKTGTTDKYRDAWFIGYTPRRALGVWVGFDKEESLGLSGAGAALPIWSRAMKPLISGRGDGAFRRPRGITTVPIDPTTGQVATSDCPNFLEEEFIRGTEPVEECQEHQPGFFDRLGRFFGL